jgi:bifunctional DNA-binding transcriptional regulator/antitoxin component of YhaV-PrlF toxin-antitoxin module
MTESTLTSKGQTTVPHTIRVALGARPGARLVWHLLPDGRISVRLKSRSVLDLGGALRQPRGRRTAVRQMNAWS